MSVEEGFLRDIVEHPDDPLPRLAYADWLEDRGDPAGLGRAEFIRAQLEMERLLGDRSPEAVRRYKEVRHRERQLLARHRAQWLGPLHGGVEAYRFRRGFLDEVRLTADQLLARGEHLSRWPTLRTVYLDGYRADLRTLLACPALAHVTHLRLNHALRPYWSGGQGLLLLTGSPHLTGVHTLELQGNYIGTTGTRILAGAGWLSGLTHLDLCHNAITDDGAEALAASPHLARLRRLDLRGNLLGEQGADLLRDRFGDRVDVRDQEDIPF